MDKIINEYLDYLKNMDHSFHNEKYALNVFKTYLDKTSLDFHRLKIKEAQEFQSYLMTSSDKKGNIRFSRATVARIITAMRHFYKYLKKKKLVYLNPFYEVRTVKKKKTLPKDILDEEKMNHLLTHLKEFWKGENTLERKQLYRAHVISELMYSTGMTIGEVMELKPEHVDFEKGSIQLKERECILNEYAIKVLKIYMDKMREVLLHGPDKTLVFGSVMNLRRWINSILKRECLKLKLPAFANRKFRVVLGFHLLRGGCDIRFIQDILGHKKLNAAQVYIRMEKKSLRNVIDKFLPRGFER